jgi:hypothetical protein
MGGKGKAYVNKVFLFSKSPIAESGMKSTRFENGEYDIICCLVMDITQLGTDVSLVQSNGGMVMDKESRIKHGQIFLHHEHLRLSCYTI